MSTDITLDELMAWDKEDNVLVREVDPMTEEISFRCDEDPHNYTWWCPPDCGTGTKPTDRYICLKNNIEWSV